MIVREYVRCAECGTAHVLRIGLGGEPVQAHQFACNSCGQEMGLFACSRRIAERGALGSAVSGKSVGATILAAKGPRFFLPYSP